MNIQDQTIDQALVELMRTQRALESLRLKRRKASKQCMNKMCNAAFVPVSHTEKDRCVRCDCPMSRIDQEAREHAHAKRASLDLSHKLSDLRQGR